MKKEEKSIIAAVAIIVIAIAIVAIIGELTLSKESNIIQGNAEATEFRVSSKVPGRILRILVKEGDHVEAGDTVALLRAPDVTAKLIQARAVEQAAAALNRQVDSGLRPQEKQAAYEQWQRAKAATDIAQKTFTRINNLYNAGVVTEQKRDEAQAALNAATAAEETAKALYSLALQGADSDERSIAQWKLRQAEGAVDEVADYASETVLTAVQSGEVSAIYPSVGELVGAGAPIMNITYLDDMWISFNIREDNLTNYCIGDTARAYIPALDRHVGVEIYFMKNLGTYAVWRATRTTGEYDVKTFEVRARPLEKVDNFYPGMSVLMNTKE